MLEVVLSLYMIIGLMWLAFNFLSYCMVMYYNDRKVMRMFARAILATPVWPLVVVYLLVKIAKSIWKSAFS